MGRRMVMSTRRRAIRIAGAAAGIAVAGFRPTRSTPPPLSRWHGRAFGAPATILLSGPDDRRLRGLIAVVVAEIDRLERIFSLMLPGSAISQLNRDGALHLPPAELRRCIRLCRKLSDASEGAFDPTVQPLWRLYAAHFALASADPRGPSPTDLTAVRRLVDYTAIETGPRRIALGRPGMAVTLNGVAQGIIADRVTDILRNEGFDNLLIDMGETRALGRHPSGRRWTIGLLDPRRPGTTMDPVELRDQAIATSGGYGTPLNRSGTIHHLFAPQTGRSANHYLSVSAIAPRAVIADGISTALAVSPPAAAQGIVNRFGDVTAILVRSDGRVERVSSTRP